MMARFLPSHAAQKYWIRIWGDLDRGLAAEAGRTAPSSIELRQKGPDSLTPSRPDTNTPFPQAAPALRATLKLLLCPFSRSASFFSLAIPVSFVASSRLSCAFSWCGVCPLPLRRHQGEPHRV